MPEIKLRKQRAKVAQLSYSLSYSLSLSLSLSLETERKKELGFGISEF